MALQPLCLLNVVGLTPAHLGEATPHLSALAAEGASGPLEGVLPAVTCTAQASLLTGAPPSQHGVVANGWLFRDTMEIRLWQQSNRLLQAEPLYVTARMEAERRGESFRCAKLFWWFNQGAAVDWSLTPKPHYGSDGSKVFGVHGSPEGFAEAAEAAVGRFPFHTFWGPMAGLPCSRWIADSAAWTLRTQRPTLTLVYLPHLDYDLQRFGATDARTAQRVREVDACVGVVRAAARETGTQVAVVSEYGLTDVRGAALPNRVLREGGWLSVRRGPFGETLDTFNSRAFAVCDHQLAHVYVRDPADRPAVRERLAALPGVASVLEGEAIEAAGLAHGRTGELVLLSERDRWFAYPYWIDDELAPDFARTVDIHRKPGYDPCELFYDPALRAPKLRAGLRLLQKKLGLRYRLDVIGLDPSIVRGSHGLPPARAEDGALWIGPPEPRPREEMRMLDVKEWALRLMGLGEAR